LYHTTGGACIVYNSMLHVHLFDGYVIISVAIVSTLSISYCLPAHLSLMIASL
uniref:Uncharacterized protein n=1 Tax=Amphimedon queenslandica TaxID=400682 RepID=A0A1X7V2C2_AMPQE